MIELPRACFIADRIAERGRLLLVRHQRPHADRARLLARRRRGRSSSPAYLERNILDRSPFETIDVAGVGALVRIARLARARGQARRSSSASAASTAATPTRSSSSTRPGSTTSPARPTGSRSRASPPPRPRYATRPERRRELVDDFHVARAPCSGRSCPRQNSAQRLAVELGAVAQVRPRPSPPRRSARSGTPIDLHVGDVRDGV